MAPRDTAVVPAFWVDADYDRNSASDGVSRFGAYIRQSSLVAESWAGTYDDDQVRRVLFAAAVWETANSPVMSPGYVRCHSRVLRARLECNWWNVTLTGVVELVTPWPAPLARSRDWQAGASWRDWPVESLGNEKYYREPGDEELSGRRYLLNFSRLAFPLAEVQLPDAPSGPGQAPSAARETVSALVGALNDVITPVISCLERS